MMARDGWLGLSGFALLAHIDGNILLARNRSRLDAGFVNTTGRHHNTAADHAVGRGRR